MADLLMVVTSLVHHGRMLFRETAARLIHRQKFQRSAHLHRPCPSLALQPLSGDRMAAYCMVYGQVLFRMKCVSLRLKAGRRELD